MTRVCAKALNTLNRDPTTVLQFPILPGHELAQAQQDRGLVRFYEPDREFDYYCNSYSVEFSSTLSIKGKPLFKKDHEIQQNYKFTFSKLQILLSMIFFSSSFFSTTWLAYIVKFWFSSDAWNGR